MQENLKLSSNTQVQKSNKKTTQGQTKQKKKFKNTKN